jgi:integrase
MNRVARLYKPKLAWPKHDLTLWHAAYRSGPDPFADCGAAAHHSPRTKLQLEYAYGKFLCFVSDCHPELLKRAPGERINRKIIEEYIRWQPATCGGVTLSVYLYHLWLALRCICPSENWSWLLAISNRIRAKAKRKPEKHHLVTSETLYALGIKLMDRIVISTDAGKSISVTDAMHYRNGLLIALLALVPLRRRTLAALRIGKHLVQFRDLWALEIPAEDTKTKRPLEFELSAELSARISLYLNQFRPRIPRAGTHDYLWASNRGRRMRDGIIYVTVRRLTREILGFPVNLHRFRHAAATFWSVRDPANILGVKDLLGHASFAATEKHYIMAQSRLAGRTLASAIRERNPTFGGRQVRFGWRGNAPADAAPTRGTVEAAYSDYDREMSDAWRKSR